MGRRRPVDLELSEEQIALRDAVRTMCERHSTPEHVRAMEGDPSDATLTHEGTLASDARYAVTLDRAPGELVARGWDAFVDACVPALVAVAAYAVGAAQKAHEMSVAYANERVQFDKPIGAFQAISHPLADMAT